MGMVKLPNAYLMPYLAINYKRVVVILMKNNEEDLISVIVATYNGERYIKEQIDSIYKQSYSNFELIVFDDCSTDNTLQILKCYESRKNFSLNVNVKNLGLVKNFEKALLASKGKYIAFCDQDDVWEIDKLEKLRSSIGNSGMIYSNAKIIDENGISKGSNLSDTSPFHGLKTGDSSLFKAVLFQGVAWGCTMLITKKVAELSLPLPLVSKNHDWWVSLVAYRNGGITYLNENLVYYRHHESNFSRGDVKINFKTMLINFFSQSALKARLRIYRSTYNDLHELRQRVGIFNFDQGELNIIDEYYNYSRSAIKNKNKHLMLQFAFRNKDYLFPSGTKGQKIIHALSRIL